MRATVGRRRATILSREPEYQVKSRAQARIGLIEGADLDDLDPGFKIRAYRGTIKTGYFFDSGLIVIPRFPEIPQGPIGIG